VPAISRSRASARPLPSSFTKLHAASQLGVRFGLDEQVNVVVLHAEVQ